MSVVSAAAVFFLCSMPNGATPTLVGWLTWGAVLTQQEQQVESICVLTKGL